MAGSYWEPAWWDGENWHIWNSDIHVVSDSYFAAVGSRIEVPPENTPETSSSPAPAPDPVMIELNRLRLLSRAELEEVIGVRFGQVGNPYESDAAIIIYLIDQYGSVRVREALRVLLGTYPKHRQGLEPSDKYPDTCFSVHDGNVCEKTPAGHPGLHQSGKEVWSHN